ncbi:ribonuclease Z [Croceivirga thetidis]|uniref:Ribonuclease Z n=1 Tax=Croceivirga thetidis TaxID=2721623 RepID=A0ABX1GPQ8_9FLAO|nr:ribonuclease Z [Croceivirga thetidis]NKI31921.1 ribonuclease Z [Croceivirga thetidis]
MRLTILGCYSATPRSLTNPTSQVLEIKNHIFLIDCGEGTQVQLRKSKVKFSRIKHIFISHLHGDHFFGLPGLISTFRLLGREKELHVYGPKGIKEAITLLLKLGDSWTNYPLHFHELNSKETELVFEDESVTVSTIPLDHRVYTNGFLFREKLAQRNLDINAVKQYKIDKSQFNNIKAGKDIVLEDGEIVKNELLTFDPPKPKSYAFCSDTAYKESIIPLIKNADLLYHESTFLESEKHLAPKTKHSTALEAASIAKKANVGQLILGHYSTRYKSIELFKEEAKAVFENVDLADDGAIFDF